jgi:hypothetical protein
MRRLRESGRCWRETGGRTPLAGLRPAAGLGMHWASAHFLEIDLGEVDETTLVVKASLQERAVPAGMEAAKRSRTLEDHDVCGAHGLSGGLCCEVAHQRVDEAADLAVKPLVVAEEDAEDLGQVGAAARPRGEHELLVRQPQQEGQSWKTLQLKGRKYSSPQSEFVHLILATPLR